VNTHGKGPPFSYREQNYIALKIRTIFGTIWHTLARFGTIWHGFDRSEGSMTRYPGSTNDFQAPKHASSGASKIEVIPMTAC
jgi:hypothetical protein